MWRDEDEDEGESACDTKALARTTFNVLWGYLTYLKTPNGTPSY
jgi:hypothetical protein